MCGITGIFQFDRIPDISVVKAMTDSLKHRGPDGEGYFLEGNVALGHRRLKIIDLSEASKQPIADAHGRSMVTYNGEIYNYLEIREILSARGHTFHSRGDAETIPAAYLEWGESFLDHLHGMFAFALYDRHNKRLLLARDRLGIKPLYFVRQAKVFAFASEPKAFIAGGLIEPRPNRSAIADYIQRGYHERDLSWYEGVSELQPGHWVTVSADGYFHDRVFWSLPKFSSEVGENPKISLRVALEGAARTHLQSDVPLGANLSGGIDSSAVVGLLAGKYPAALNTFSVYFREGSYYDERPFIQKVSQLYGTTHHYTVPTWQEAQSQIHSIIDAVDGISAGQAVIPTYLLYRDIRNKGVVVTNGGQGGDEMFAGYPRHLLPYALYELSTGFSGWPNALRSISKLGIKGLARVAAERALTPGRFMLHPDLSKSVEPFRYSLSFPELFQQYLLGYLHCLLQVEDRTSMAASVESRVPLLDDAVTLVAASMHPRWMLRGGVPKRVLRDAVADLLPPEVLYRRDKRGLPTPFGIWLRGPLKTYAQATLSDPSLASYELFQMHRVLRLFKMHCAGIGDLGPLLWRPFSVAIWLQNLQSFRPFTTSMSAERQRRLDLVPLRPGSSLSG